MNKKITTKESLEGKIENWLHKTLDNKNKYEISESNPRDILNYRRFDVMAKYVYAKHKKNNVSIDFARNLYKEHLRILNSFQEKNNNKNNFNDFLESFDDLLKSIEKNTFNKNLSVVPLGSDNNPLNGAHRLGACLADNVNVNTLKLKKNSYSYDFSYFREKGLKEEYLDYMATSYCQIKKPIFIAVVFPIALPKEKDIREILGSYGNIFYEKNISFNRTGIHNLVIQMYRDHKWIDIENNNFSGALKHSIERYIKNEPVKIFAIESTTIEKMKEAKKIIRDMFNLGNFPIHIADTEEEVVRLAEQLFNKNSIFFLNNSSYKNSKKFRKLFGQFKHWISENKHEKDNFCIDSSSVLSSYGLRDVKDLDYIDKDNKLCDIKGIDNHKSQEKYYSKNLNELIFNPENYFYYDGFKFLDIKNVKKMKEKRNELKDKRDIELINKILTNRNIFKRILGYATYCYKIAPGMIIFFIKRHIPKTTFPFALKAYRLIKKIAKK